MDDEVTTTTEPSVDDLLNWDTETQGDIPENLRTLSIEDARTAVTAREAAAATRREQEILARLSAENERARLDSNRTAQEQLDADYYTQLRNKLASADPAISDAARQELLVNETRYQAGAAALSRSSAQSQQNEVLRSFFDNMSKELEAAGIKGVIPPVGDPGWLQVRERLAAFDGKGGIAAYLIEHGRALARADYEVELARAQRIDAGASGAPNLGGGGGVAKDNYADPTWVKAQMEKDPEWAFAVSPDGKMKNIQRVRREAVPALRGAR